MSMSVLVLAGLSWSELNHILQFLTIKELLFGLGRCNRSGFIICQREKHLRNSVAEMGNFRFLSKYSNHDKIGLVSYPRCGNSFLRKVLEVKTSIISGSDSRPNRPLAVSLLKYGYRGEGITDSSVWFIKSHYPERLGYIRFKLQRCIVIVRNPFDALESYFHMAMTNTHNKRLSKKVFKELQPIWSDFIVNEARIWFDFLIYWLNNAVLGFPVLFIRYEDLLLHETEISNEVLSFMHQGKVPYNVRSGSISIAKRSENCEVSSINSNASLQPTRSPPGYLQSQKRHIGSSLQSMTRREALSINEIAGHLFDLFGYKVLGACAASIDTGADNGIATAPTFTACNLPEHSDRQIILNVNSFESQAVVDKFIRLRNSGGNVSFMYPPKSQPAASATEITMNANFTIRVESDIYGRGITALRMKHTANDSEPFELATDS